MLHFLRVRNLAIIESIELELGPGFNVLTGETGAGKSILIDAIGLALGSRADGGLIRSGCEQAEVTAEFTVDPSKDRGYAWLEEHQLIDAEESHRCVIRRLIRSEGRSRSFVNDRAVGLAALQELGGRLIEIFGQGESQTLTFAETQRALLDAYGVDPELLRLTADAAKRVHHLERRIADRQHSGRCDPEHLDFLRFQLEELSTLSLQPNEIATLDTEHTRLAHAEQILLGANQARDRLYGGDQSVYDQVTLVQGMIDGLAKLDSGFAPISELTAGIQVQLSEAADLLQNLLARTECDPQQLQEVERRVTAVQDLARKHRVGAAELPTREATLREELEALEAGIREIESLQSEVGQAHGNYVQHANQLSQKRSAVATQLETAISDHIRQLGMPEAAFAIEIQTDDLQPPAADGNDRIRFTFTANPGQAAQPLAKVASGGELSRIGLAIQVALRRITTAPTMIFDEVDAGIGGGVADIVGERLRILGEKNQVLCVTHLPQVAAKGQRHIHIAKDVRRGETYTRIQLLDPSQRIAELARMSGGRTISAVTEAHARELLKGSAGKKKVDRNQAPK